MTINSILFSLLDTIFSNSLVPYQITLCMYNIQEKIIGRMCGSVHASSWFASLCCRYFSSVHAFAVTQSVHGIMKTTVKYNRSDRIKKYIKNKQMSDKSKLVCILSVKPQYKLHIIMRPARREGTSPRRWVQ